MMLQVRSASVAARRLAPAHGMVGRRFSAMLTFEEEYPGTPATSPSPLPAAVTMVTTLSNGAKVVSRNNGDKVASVGLMVGCGSRDEGLGQDGVSLLLQRMAFKSTTARSSIRLHRDMEIAGASIGTCGGREQTVYLADCLPEAAGVALSAMTETALSAKLSPWEIKEAMQKVDAVDLKNHLSSAQSLLDQTVHQAAFGNESPLGKPMRTSCHVNQEALRGFKSDCFVPSSMAVIGVGVPHEELVGYAESAMAGTESKEVPVRAPCSFVGGEVRLAAEGELTSVALAFPAPAAGDNESATYEVLAALMDARVKASVPLSGAFGASYSDTGMVGVCAAAPAGEVASMVAALTSCLKDLASGPTAAEVTSVVASVKVSRHLQMENPKDAVGALAEALASGQDPAAIGNALGGVTAQGLKAAVAKALSSGPAVAAVGEIVQVPKKDEIVKMLA